jgi:hypothetical protein
MRTQYVPLFAAHPALTASMTSDDYSTSTLHLPHTSSLFHKAAMFVMGGILILTHTECAPKFMIYLHTKLHLPGFNN